jgi:hypothetical protein
MTQDPSKLVDKSLEEGWKMRKLIQSSSYGFFHNQSAVYDERTVYNRKDLEKLVNEGFFLDMDAGLLALNILLKI